MTGKAKLFQLRVNTISEFVSGFLAFYMTVARLEDYVIDALQLIIVIQSVSIPFTLAYAKGTAEQEFLDAVLSPRRGRIIAGVLLLILTALIGYNVSKLKIIKMSK